MGVEMKLSRSWNFETTLALTPLFTTPPPLGHREIRSPRRGGDGTRAEDRHTKWKNRAPKNDGPTKKNDDVRGCETDTAGVGQEPED